MIKSLYLIENENSFDIIKPTGEKVISIDTKKLSLSGKELYEKIYSSFSIDDNSPITVNISIKGNCADPKTKIICEQLRTIFHSIDEEVNKNLKSFFESQSKQCDTNDKYLELYK